MFTSGGVFLAAERSGMHGCGKNSLQVDNPSCHWVQNSFITDSSGRVRRDGMSQKQLKNRNHERRIREMALRKGLIPEECLCLCRFMLVSNFTYNTHRMKTILISKG